MIQGTLDVGLGGPGEDAQTLQRARHLAAGAPLPARVGPVLTGTAGWTDPTLIKSHRFYPRGSSSSEARLRFYASQFPLVEVDASYYALPTRANAERWVERTPRGFVFDVKAFAALTGHPVELGRLPRDLQSALPDELRARGRVSARELPGELAFEVWKRFKDAIAPLHEANKLGCVLLQFPPWFTATRANARYLEVCRARMGELPLAVEFRHPSWVEPARVRRVMDHLRRHRLAYVAVDERGEHAPRAGAPVIDVAHPALAVVRFHGRRLVAPSPEAAGTSSRYDYLYDPSELRAWLPAIARLAERAERVHAVFNNCVADHAVLAARGLAALLAHEPPHQAALSA